MTSPDKTLLEYARDQQRTEFSRTCSASHETGYEDIPVFQYQRLEDPHNIRLLHVLPGATDDVACCECKSYSACDGPLTPKYTAISYTWGDPTDREVIIVNGCRFYATKSAKEVLVHIHDVRDTEVCWQDASCIDPENELERNGASPLDGRFVRPLPRNSGLVGLRVRGQRPCHDSIPRLKAVY